ncbi:hypothetical protein Vadar_011152 [Vaccinium darrowii]|uniref:Uncharacterized protein n=1 Tax=Vaccinium darrowii TaxID=229202 RepID=A0ACB7Y790_9ERIC|nr:hypothetical protein Vadar_011152 [Vaccinium darrowii]
MSKSRSTLLKGVEETRTKRSQPSTKQSWRKRQRAATAVVGEDSAVHREEKHVMAMETEVLNEPEVTDATASMEEELTI